MSKDVKYSYFGEGLDGTQVKTFIHWETIKPHIEEFIGINGTEYVKGVRATNDGIEVILGYKEEESE